MNYFASLDWTIVFVTIGTAQSDQVMDIRDLTDPKVRPARWLPKFIVAALPYVGCYVIGIALTGYLATASTALLTATSGPAGGLDGYGHYSLLALRGTWCCGLSSRSRASITSFQVS